MGSCRRSSYLERVLKQIEEHFPGLDYELEKSMYEPGVTDRTVRKLRIDIFIPVLNLAIEVDGEHHHKPIDYVGDPSLAWSGFERRKMLDRKKDCVAQQLGWKLVRLDPNDVESGKVVEIIRMELEGMLN